MKKIWPLLLAFLLLAGCAQKEQTDDVSEPTESASAQVTETAASEPQTALEAVADGGEQEIRLPLGDEGMAVSATVQDSGMRVDFPPETTTSAGKKQTTVPSARTTAAATAKADAEAKGETTTTTTTKPAASQNTTTTAAATTAKAQTSSAASANVTPKTTSAATLPTADAEKGRYELPAIPLG